MRIRGILNMYEGLLSKLVKFCEKNDCAVEFNQETQKYEIWPVPKKNPLSDYKPHVFDNLVAKAKANGVI